MLSKLILGLVARNNTTFLALLGQFSGLGSVGLLKFLHLSKSSLKFGLRSTELLFLHSKGLSRLFGFSLSFSSGLSRGNSFSFFSLSSSFVGLSSGKRSRSSSSSPRSLLKSSRNSVQLSLSLFNLLGVITLAAGDKIVEKLVAVRVILEQQVVRKRNSLRSLILSNGTGFPQSGSHFEDSVGFISLLEKAMSLQLVKFETSSTSVVDLDTLFNKVPAVLSFWFHKVLPKSIEKPNGLFFMGFLAKFMQLVKVSCS
mmetsp:Transcript_12039/g.18342  ORF Transcript_12039/g.18342 Transcript_12039/m.18342 type:complete len:256 (+) Transcript_12039:499-1266(+)